MKVYVCILSFYHYEGDFSISQGDQIAVETTPAGNFFTKDDKLVPIEDSMIKTYLKEDQFALV